MTINKSVLRNAAALSVPNFLNPAISFVLVMIISRYLGVSGLGIYSLVLSYVVIFVILASLGLATLIVREVARRPQEAHAFFVNSAAFGTISSLVALVAMNAVVAAMGYEKEVFHASLIMSFSLVKSTASGYIEAIFRSIEKSEYIAVTYVTENLIRVGICICLVVSGHGIVSLFWAILGTRVFGFFLIFAFYVRVLGMPGWEFRPDIWRVLAREAPTFASITIFATIHLSIDQIMLSKLKSIDAVGIYSAADRLLDVCKTFPLAFAAALLPFFAKEFVEGVPRLKVLTESATRYLFLGSFPVVLGTVILGDQIIALIYGTKFVASIPVLRLHIVSLIPFSLVYLLAHVLIATDNQRVDLKINIVAAALNVGLNFVLIPPFAEIGAVLATLITLIVFNQLQYWYIKRYLFSIRFFELFHKVLVATAGMGALTYVMRDLNLAANIIISAAAYLLLLLLLKALSPGEVQFLKKLLGSSGTKERS